MNWNEYVLRRRVDTSKWLASRGIFDRDQFLVRLKDLELDPPDDAQLAIMFPPESKNESDTLTPERVDTSTSRSLADEGDGSSLRSDGKRSSKVRVR
jgi:hypothetical protein